MGWTALIFGILACAAPAPAAAEQGSSPCSEGQVLDGEQCVPEACGVGQFGSAEGDVYVLAGANGDGTKDRPFGSISEATATLEQGAVAIGGGTYFENLTFGRDHRQISLRGRCRELVELDGSTEDAPAVSVIKTIGHPLGVSLSGLTVRGGTYGLVAAGAEVVVSDAAFLENGVVGIIASDDGEVELESVEVDSVQSVGRESGRGIAVQLGATLRGSHLRIAGNPEGGVVASGVGTTVVLADAEITDGTPDEHTVGGAGVSIAEGATLRGERVTIARNAIGLFTEGLGTSVTLADSVIEDSGAPGRSTFGLGAWAEKGATLDLVGTHVRRNTNIGVLGRYSGTTVTLTDTQVSDTRPAEDFPYGCGVQMQEGAALVAVRLMVSANSTCGVGSLNTGTTVALDDTVVVGTRLNPVDEAGVGVAIDLGGSATIQRSYIGGNAGLGIYVSGVGSAATVSSTTIGDDGNPLVGPGLQVDAGAQLTADHIVVRGVLSYGVVATLPGSKVTMTDSRVEGVRADQGTLGIGIGASEGAVLTAERVSVVRSADIGVVAEESGSVVNLTDVQVRDTMASLPGLGGRAVAAIYGGTLNVERLTIENSTAVGFFVGGDGANATVNGASILATRAPLDGLDGYGVAVQDGGELDASGLVVAFGAGTGVFAHGRGSVVALNDSLIQGTQSRADGTGGRGMTVEAGASVTVRGSTVLGSHEAGILAMLEDTAVVLQDVVVRGTLPGSDMAIGLGISAQSGATMDGERVEITDVEGPGIYAVSGASMRCRSCTVANNAFAGAIVDDAWLTLRDSTVSTTRPSAELNGGFGVFAESKAGNLMLNLNGNSIGPHPYAAVWLSGPGEYIVKNNELIGGASVAGRAWAHGNAIFAQDVGSTSDAANELSITGNRITDAEELAVFLHDSFATFGTNDWVRNAVDLRQQHCENVPGIDASDIAAPAPPTLVLCTEGQSDLLYDTSVEFPGIFLKESAPAEGR